MRTSTIWKVLVFALAVQAAAMDGAEAAISCSTVIADLVPCLSYVTGSAASPPAACCNGVKTLNAAAQTTPDRQAACKCIKSAAASYHYNSAKADKIPALCGVNIGIPISPSTSCDTIH
uniref:Non-specific lipid-transfer protein n=1 Tax=Picea sitchensis TaxID=3332 RepID=A9NPT8_PICSI|nr:unknown [Picea sitchensis]ABK25515.1 unknown [Picea sitchensis]ACN40466.1 unknown [Picea sitchensis]